MTGERIILHETTNQRPAREFGVDSAGDSADPLPESLDGAVTFVPAGDLVPVALRGAGPRRHPRDGRIYLSDIPALDYATVLFQERRLRSVTANTRADGEEFLRIAVRHGSPRSPSRTTSTRPTGHSPTSPTAGSAGATVLQVS